MCVPAATVVVALNVADWSCHWSISGVPSRKRRIPSSAVTLKVVLPPGKENWPDQRTEKPSAEIPAAGLPLPQSWLIDDSHCSSAGVPESVVLLKYCASHVPAEHVPVLP